MAVKVKVDRPIMAETEPDLPEELQLKVKKYLRGDAANLEGLKDKKLRGQLAVREKIYGHSAKAAAKAEKWLMPSGEGYLEAEGLEKTWRFKQESIINEVDMLSSRKPFDMILPDFGPYKLNFTPSGRHMLLAGRKGHLSIIDMFSLDLVKEFQVKETVRDVTFLHNEQFFAAAQKKYPYIYNRHGVELHCLKEHVKPRKLQFLDKHFLLVSINKFGQLHYQDVSTGLMVANFKTSLGRTDVMEVNPFNSIIGLGHSGGKVTMWKPTSSKPLVTMLCHPGPVTALAFHNGGHIMATAGMDNRIKIWDVRKFEVLHIYPGRAMTLDFSQKGLLAAGNGSQVEIRRDSIGNHDFCSYMKHSMVKGFQIEKTVFRPYEDVLGIGHSMGISCILVPGSGEPNFDTWVANPYETSKQRREREVHALLDKLPPESIMLNPKLIGNMRSWREKERPTKQEIEGQKEAAVKDAKNITLKRKTKGRSKPSKRTKRKREEVEKAKKPYLDQPKLVTQPTKRQKTDNADLPKALQRFARKKPA